MTAALACGAQAAPSTHDARPPAQDQLTLYVPAPPGGGFEQVATAMKAALESEGLVREVTVEHHPGGGGLLGLSQFAEAHRGDPHALLVAGVGVIYSARMYGSPVTLLDTTPIARLSRDYYVVAVPAVSPLRNARDLLSDLSARPYDLHWTGDQPGDGAERLVWQIAAAAHVAPVVQPYSPRFGGANVVDFLQHGDTELVGVVGYGEIAPALADGRVRLLGVAAPGAAFAGVPTLRAQGLDIVAANWRGVFAPPGTSPEQRRRLIEMMGAMVRSPAWRDALRRRSWEDAFLAGDAFEAFVADEQERVSASSTPERVQPVDAAPWPEWLGRWGVPTVAAAAAAAAAAGYAVWWRRRAARRSATVSATLDPIERLDDSGAGAQPVVAAINAEFDAWKLSAAERDVAWFLLKGLPMKEIARLRGASERTVRQQARAVYGKAGLEGRSDLAAHILDRCLVPAGAPVAEVASAGAAPGSQA